MTGDAWARSCHTSYRAAACWLPRPPGRPRTFPTEYTASIHVRHTAMLPDIAKRKNPNPGKNGNRRQRGTVRQPRKRDFRQNRQPPSRQPRFPAESATGSAVERAAPAKKFEFRQKRQCPFLAPCRFVSFVPSVSNLVFRQNRQPPLPPLAAHAVGAQPAAPTAASRAPTRRRHEVGVWYPKRPVCQSAPTSLS